MIKTSFEFEPPYKYSYGYSSIAQFLAGTHVRHVAKHSRTELLVRRTKKYIPERKTFSVHNVRTGNIYMLEGMLTTGTTGVGRDGFAT